MDGSPWQTVKGRDALKAKVEKWGELVQEVHSIEVSDPLIAANFICLKMTYDVTRSDVGRSLGEEICLYTVEDGKIVREQFFYSV